MPDVECDNEEEQLKLSARFEVASKTCFSKALGSKSISIVGFEIDDDFKSDDWFPECRGDEDEFADELGSLVGS